MHISKAGGFYSGTWTTKGCIPVSDYYYSTYFSAETLYVGTCAQLIVYCVKYLTHTHTAFTMLSKGSILMILIFQPFASEV